VTNWRERGELELKRAEEALKTGNEGRARVAARRAVALTYEAWNRRAGKAEEGKNSIERLQELAADPRLPVSVRDAAGRLAARIRPDFTSPSARPLDDARTIIDALAERIDRC
jgi:HEPN domain-containing protein